MRIPEVIINVNSSVKKFLPASKIINIAARKMY